LRQRNAVDREVGRVIVLHSSRRMRLAMTRTELLSMTVDDVMARWPETVPVFHRRRMACPGCVMAPFMTVAEAARSYAQPEDELAADLARAIPPETTEPARRVS
jgi:hybrid cluster-associated redox disulfide protein